MVDDNRTSGQRVMDWAKTRRVAIAQEIERLQQEDKRCATILERFGLSYSRPCNRCRKIMFMSEPITADVFYCSNACAD